MSQDLQFVVETMRAQASQIEDLRRRLASVVMVGQVDQASGDKQRVVFDEKDASTGEPFKSPMLRRASAAGKDGNGHKERNRPVIGETVAVINPNGEIGKHSRVIPYGPTDESGEPAGDEGFARVFSEGNASIAIKAGEIRFKVGATTVTVTAAGVDQTGGHHKHEGKNTGKDHIHGGIVAGGDNTDIPAN